ncbi:MAG: hypothetical protein HC869_02580 [Rhodospirillales bacterium]|nr:hypothetical protein [Rhodospirillales bacterium]
MSRLLVAATIVIVLTNPSGAQGRPTWNEASQHDRSLFAQCMQDWDRDTHMTTTVWAQACQRVLRDHE